MHSASCPTQIPACGTAWPDNPCNAKPFDGRARAMSRKQKQPGNGTGAARAWQRMLSGRRLDLLDPSPLDIEIDDIAHGLARVARWNGQTKGDHAFTVAEHCVLVDDICARFRPGWPAKWRLAALLHDAPEYEIGRAKV